VRRFPTADVLVDHATAWLNENSGQPFFLWLHFMDPHYPYVPKPEALEYLGEKRLSGHEVEYLNSYWNRGDLSTARLMRKRDDVVKLYDAGIRWVDEQVRRLTETLVDLNLWDKCVLALTADHGEEFLDHGGRFHAPEKLTEELIRVPLLIRVPGVAGRRVEDVISHVDVAPTLLDILDLPAPADFRGRSSWGSVTSNRRWERHAITECVQGCTNPFQTNKRMGSRVVSIRKREHKLVMHFSAGREEFFDLTTDHGERNPIPPGQNDPSRRELLKLARKHVAESRKSRDFDRRRALLLRDLRLEWAHSATQVLQ
jgi:arylsulfatase A-like enzyme